MPRKCTVQGCRSNYVNTKPYVTAYRFPQDETERNRWIAALPNQNFVWTAHKCVCKKHWPENFKRFISKGGRYIPADPPSVFHGVPPLLKPLKKPTHYSERPSFIVLDRSIKPVEQPQVETLPVEEEEEDPDIFTFEKCLHLFDDDETIQTFQLGNELWIASAIRVGSTHVFAVIVDMSTAAFHAYHLYRSVRPPFLQYQYFTALSQVTELISWLRDYSETSEQGKFLNRQVELFSKKDFNENDLFIALTLRSFGSAAYDTFRRYAILPCTRTLTRLRKLVADDDPVKSAADAESSDLQESPEDLLQQENAEPDPKRAAVSTLKLNGMMESTSSTASV